MTKDECEDKKDHYEKLFKRRYETWGLLESNHLNPKPSPIKGELIDPLGSVPGFTGEN